MIDIETKLKKIFGENGIYFKSVTEELDMDSISFISLIVEIENEFELEFPDDDLMISRFKNFQDYINKVKELI